MTLLPALLLVAVAWGQPNPNGEASKAVQQQEKQADYARKGHPQSGKPRQQEPASLRTKENAGKAPKPKHGEASIRTQK